MKFQKNLEEITTIWDEFILKYKFFHSKINNNNLVISTNYFGDIVSYINDSIPIVFDEKKYSDFSDRFSYYISLLQSIYVQQDFIEELLLIFKCGIIKRDLLRDKNYSINREIRNEIIGHPIRKNKGKLISSSILGYKPNEHSLIYMRYHRDNDFECEILVHDLHDVIKRHESFLNNYTDILLKKLKSFLPAFRRELEKFDVLFKKGDFNTLINFTTIYLESIFEDNICYKKELLLKIYSQIDSHVRYKNFINIFLRDLKTYVDETIEFMDEKLICKKYKKDASLVNTVITFDNPEQKTKRNNYHYELGKLATKRNREDFCFFSSILKVGCKDNPAIQEELQHMENNLNDEIEYYCALRMIYTILSN